MSNPIYYAEVDANGVLVVGEFGSDEVDAAAYARSATETIYFFVTPPPTIARVKSVLRANSDRLLDHVAESVVLLGAASSYGELEGSIIESLVELVHGFGLPRLNTENLPLWREAANVDGLDYDDDMIGGPL